ncbi:MAG: 2-hydroxychromene-2-carboxylate isomerase [Rhodospirillales bacterium]|nr:MAG: 2-hydroxychromene-2-carboxylate isomerase [Rhodospirillales bacterium]
MTASVEFHFDFGSPNAYLSHRLIPGIEKRTGVKFKYVPVLLGGVFKLTNNAAPMVQYKDVKHKLAYQRREMARFIARHGLSRFAMNPHFPVNTVQIMRGAVAADIDGKLAPYVEAVFRAMWEDGLKMDDSEVIKTALDAAGIDGARILARIQDQDVKDRLLKNTEESVARGTFGSPMLYVGDEPFFGKDRLRDVEEEIASPLAKV